MGDYYRVNGAMACVHCAEKVRGNLPKDSHAAFVRGIMFGIGGAILGLILYSAFSIITGLIIGYVSLAVGYIVGKAILMGSKGLGGRRYQIAAVLLTYAAVSLSAVPIAISQANKVKEARGKIHASASQSNPVEVTQSRDIDAPSAEGTAVGTPHMSIPAVLGTLALIGLASPFLELQNMPSGAIGLVILFVGLRIAWSLTAAKVPTVLGPFKASAPSPA